MTVKDRRVLTGDTTPYERGDKSRGDSQGDINVWSPLPGIFLLRGSRAMEALQIYNYFGGLRP